MVRRCLWEIWTGHGACQTYFYLFSLPWSWCFSWKSDREGTFGGASYHGKVTHLESDALHWTGTLTSPCCWVDKPQDLSESWFSHGKVRLVSHRNQNKMDTAEEKFVKHQFISFCWLVLLYHFSPMSRWSLLAYLYFLFPFPSVYGILETGFPPDVVPELVVPPVTPSTVGAPSLSPLLCSLLQVVYTSRLCMRLYNVLLLSQRKNIFKCDA